MVTRFIHAMVFFTNGLLAGKILATLLMLLFAVGCGGDGFSATEIPDVTIYDAGSKTPEGASAADARPDDVDAGPDAARVDVDAPSAEQKDVLADAGPGDGDGATCTPVTYTEPTTCACFFAGSCPIVDGGPSKDCLWAETPTTVTGQPTCRGCGQIATKKNNCRACKETFTCACLAAYLDPGQKCCDGPGGPYLTDYACP